MQNEGQLSKNLLLTAVYNRSKAGEKQWLGTQPHSFGDDLPLMISLLQEQERKTMKGNTLAFLDEIDKHF